VRGVNTTLSIMERTRLTAEAISEIEEWRRQQPIIPSRTDAIRELVRKGLAASKAEAEKREGKKR